MANGAYRIAKKEYRCELCALAMAHEKCNELWGKVSHEYNPESPPEDWEWRERLAEEEVQHG